MGIKCPTCNSSNNTVKRGFRIVSNQKMQRVYCKQCTKYFLVKSTEESTVNSDPKFACPQCANINIFVKNTTLMNNKMMQRCFCQICNAYYFVELNTNEETGSTRVDEAKKLFDDSLKETLSEHEKYMYSPKCFFCHAESLNMAFPARIVAISHEEAAEKMSEDIIAKIADPEQVARIAKNLVIHVFDSNKNIVAIYKSSNVKVEFIQENILDVDLDDISE